MITCVIIDDEPLARQGLTRYVQDVGFLHLAGTCENPLQLSAIIEREPVDLLFLDIQMPKMNGLDFLRSTSTRPMVVITTAFPSFALEGFQLDVLDYLVKPITFDRFFKAANKARDYQNLLNKGNATHAHVTDDYFFVKCDGRFEKIVYDEILYAEGMQNYVIIHTAKRKLSTLLTLKTLEESLSHRPFMRVHKSFIVSLKHVDSIETHEIMVHGARIPLSRNYREHVMEKVLARKLLDRK